VKHVLIVLDPFSWWAASISGGSVFLTLVAIYLYVSSRSARKKIPQVKRTVASVIREFTFVWVLLGLLVFYIVAISVGSAVLFAVGNIFVEILLLLYLVRNRSRESE